MMKSIAIFFLYILILLFSGCVSDQKGQAGDTSNVSTESSTVKTGDHEGHDHSGHDHAGHDHSGHDHSSHNHSKNDSKPKKTVSKIQNNNAGTQEIKFDKEKQLAALEESKGDVSEEQYNAKKQAIKEAPASIKKAKHPSLAYDQLPDACSLITESQIAKVIGVDAQGITVKDGSGPAASHARACFFRWDHKGIANSGVMVQVQDNPLPDEFPDWAAYYINAKLTEGDKRPDATQAFKYKKLEDIGVSGAYSYDMHRYLWRTEEGFVIGVAFNLPGTEAEEVAWAKKIGAVVMKNFKR